jgi:hypothetical protein
MKKCKLENLIDEYLFDRLDETQKESFEEHYFSCHQCFEKLEEKNEMIAVIKTKGDEIFQDVYAPTKIRRSWLDSVLAFLTPRQWAMAAVSAALILVVSIGIIPNLKTSTPEFFINDDLVRGSSITLISPMIDNLEQIPSEFRWQSLGENTEYKLFIFHQEELLWSTTTEENFVTLSENTKSLMAPGKKYSWQVKAFSPEGTLIAVSSRVQFNFLSSK